MHIPQWLTIAIAILVIAFGIHRIRIARRTPQQEADAPKRRGLYGMSSRAHYVIGSLYLLLGAALIATGLGWNPFGGMFGPETAPPAKGAEPTKTLVPIDGLQPKK